jgi:hypothetical protein
MGFSRYKKLLIPYLIILIALALLIPIGMIFQQSGESFLSLGIGNTTTDTFFLIFGAIGTGMLGALIGGYLFCRLFLFTHKKTIGRKMVYAIQERSKSEIFKKAFMKSLFPALLALNICLILYDNSTIQALLLNPNAFAQQNAEAVIPIFTISALIPLASAIGMGLFSPVWFLQDGGIIYSNKNKVKNLSDPLEIRSVGGWYLYLLKGYAGISVIVNYYGFLSGLFTTSVTSSVLFVIIWPIMPFLFTFLMIPGIIVLDITFDKRKKFVLKNAEKLRITEKVEPLSF